MQAEPRPAGLELSGRLDHLIEQAPVNSARKELEAKLAESEEKFRVLSEAMPQMVWASHRDGRAYYLNQRWLDYTGQSYAEAEGLGWLKALHPEDVPVAQDRWTEAVATGKPYEAEYRIKAKDGKYRWFLSRGMPERSTAETEQWVGTCTDISAQKEVEQSPIKGGSRFQSAAREDFWSSPLRTQGSESPGKNSISFSRVFRRRIVPSLAGMAAQDWDLLSPRAWWN